MFGRRWKFHDEPKTSDLETAQESCSVRQASKIIEVLTLHVDEIVKQIMKADKKVVVTYSDDGSKKQGAGAFCVQGITVNGTHRALPTLSVASESKRNLVALKIALFSTS